MSPRPGGDVSNSSEFATMGSGEYRAEIERRRSAGVLALEIARRHTGLILVLTYLTVTVVARMEDVWFFRHFRINIFNYSDPEDFFTASMRNSEVWLFFLVPTLILFGVSWFLSKRLTSEKPAILAAKWNRPGLRLALSAIVVVAVAAAATSFKAKQRFGRVEAGRGRHVTFARTDGVSYDEQPLLIGTTGSFFFLYYVQRKVTEIVPVENTALMTVDLQSKTGNPAPATGATGNTPRLNR
jgi:hypothetical protein